MKFKSTAIKPNNKETVYLSSKEEQLMGTKGRYEDGEWYSVNSDFSVLPNFYLPEKEYLKEFSKINLKSLL